MPFGDTFHESGQTGMFPEWARRILMAAPYVGLPYTAARIGGAIYRGLNNPYSTNPNSLDALQGNPQASAPPANSPQYSAPAPTATPSYSSPSESVWNAGYLMGGNQMSNLAANNYANIIRNKQR